jgi:AAA+ superfamily predicted ATPase
MCQAIHEIFREYEDGHAALLVHGRSVRDLVVDDEGRVRPALEAIRRLARCRYGLHLITYSMAEGLDWDASRLSVPADRSAIEQTLKTHGLLDLPPNEHEIVRVIRGIASLARTPRGTRRWSDGPDLSFMFLFEFAEHLAPGTLANGTQTDQQLVAIELAHLVGQSLALRSSGNLVLLHGRDGLIDQLVTSAVQAARLRLPDRPEKLSFLQAAWKLYPDARFEDGLTSEHVAHLTTGTPNRGLEQLLRASQRAKRAVTAKELTAQKTRDVAALSEETMTVLDPSRVAGAELVGRNIQVPASILRQLAGRLRTGDSRMPANVLLTGAPGTGKTDLAIIAADAAGASAYALNSPKRGIVGETERLARRQQELLAEFAPAVAFVDEITEMLPMQRSDFDGDSGASRAVMAAWLTSLSDDSRRGRQLLIATTNCPWRISAAMRSRFVFIPVLQPISDDMPAIVAAMAARVQPGVKVSASGPRIIEAAAIFYAKAASPRHIREALTNALIFEEALTPGVILDAARALESFTDRASAIYADLWAIRSCASHRFLPWYDDPGSYPYPNHLRGLVDDRSGEVDLAELDRRIEEYRPHADV